MEKYAVSKDDSFEKEAVELMDKQASLTITDAREAVHEEAINDGERSNAESEGDDEQI